MAMQLPRGKKREYRARAGELLPAVLLPPPPSANHMYRFVPINGTVRPMKSSEYNQWIEAADPIVSTLRSPLAYPCAVHVCCVGKWFRQRDLDNMLKAVLDALKRCGVIAADNLACVGALTVTQERSEAPPLMRVSITEIGTNLFGG